MKLEELSSYRSCTLVLGEAEARARGAVLLWGESLALLPCSFFQDTNPGCRTGQLLIRPAIATQGTHKCRHAHQGVSKGRTPALPAVSLQLQPPACPSKCSPPARSPGGRCCPRAAPTHPVASLPHGNIHPEHSVLLFLPTPRKATAWGRWTCPWGASIPTSQASYQLSRKEPNRMGGEEMAALFALLKTPKLPAAPLPEPTWTQGSDG